MYQDKVTASAATEREDHWVEEYFLFGATPLNTPVGHGAETPPYTRPRAGIARGRGF
ncbi:MAG: hypothetical protein M3O71_07660 [Bacteroidota bacterium]|nr:hypothetical protein [Bacteroidota bacterium]